MVGGGASLCPHHTNICKIWRLWAAISLLAFEKSLSNSAVLKLILRRSFQWCQCFSQICPCQKFKNRGSIVINILRPFFHGQWNRIMIPPAVNNWYYFTYIKIYLAGFLKRLLPNGPFASNSFFFLPKSISKVAIIKTKSATIAFFSSPHYPPSRSFFFSFPFPLLLIFFSLSGRKHLPFEGFSLTWLTLLLGWFSKNWLGYYYLLVLIMLIRLIRIHFDLYRDVAKENLSRLFYQSILLFHSTAPYKLSHCLCFPE